MLNTSILESVELNKDKPNITLIFLNEDKESENYEIKIEAENLEDAINLVKEKYEGFKIVKVEQDF